MCGCKSNCNCSTTVSTRCENIESDKPSCGTYVGSGAVIGAALGGAVAGPAGVLLGSFIGGAFGSTCCESKEKQS